jgi:hypothetical protein
MKVVAVVVLIAVLVVLIAPVVHLGPAARLVRAGHALQNVLSFLPATLPPAIPQLSGTQLQHSGIASGESLPVFPIFSRDCVFLC